MARNFFDIFYAKGPYNILQYTYKMSLKLTSICRAVSREWNIMTQSPSLWAKIDYSVCRHQVSDYAAAKLGL